MEEVDKILAIKNNNDFANKVFQVNDFLFHKHLNLKTYRITFLQEIIIYFISNNIGFYNYFTLLFKKCIKK